MFAEVLEGSGRGGLKKIVLFPQVNLDLLQVDLLAGGRIFFFAAKSHEIPRHMKSDEGLF